LNTAGCDELEHFFTCQLISHGREGTDAHFWASSFTFVRTCATRPLLSRVVHEARSTLSFS
jgi:hypothetical protein